MLATARLVEGGCLKQSFLSKDIAAADFHDDGEAEQLGHRRAPWLIKRQSTSPSLKKPVGG